MSQNTSIPIHRFINMSSTPNSQSNAIATSLTEGVFEHPKDLFTKERIRLMHKQIDNVTTFIIDLIPPEGAASESRKIFSLMLITIRAIILGCFSSSSQRALTLLAHLPPIVDPKRISSASRKFKTLLDTVLIVLQLKGQSINLTEQLKIFDTLSEIPELPSSYKGCLIARHHYLIHQELDKYLVWTRDSAMFAKNNHTSSMLLGKMFNKIIKRMMCSYLNHNTDLWIGLITSSKKSVLSLRDPNPNQNISNYAFLRGVFLNGYYVTRKLFGKSGPVVVNQ
jgi:hypothetical protein